MKLQVALLHLAVLSFASPPALIGSSSDAEAQVNSIADCIVVAEDDGNSRSFRNVCNETLHADFEIVNSCGSRDGGFTFAPGAGPVNLMRSGCAYNYWVCDMSDWNANGGSCR